MGNNLSDCVLGVDIGTFESKGVLSDRDGNILAQSARPHKMLVPQKGWAEHDAEANWWGDFVEITRELIAKSGISPNQIKAVATSAIGPCMLPVDEAGKPLMNGVLYGVDTRAAEEIKLLNDKIGEERILKTCGNALTSQSVGPKILWLKRNRPELWQKTAHFITSTSYLVSQLTGKMVMDHYTAAGFSPLYNVDTQSWNLEHCEDFVSEEQLPELMWSTEIAGKVTPWAAEQTGLAEGTPVTCGTIDAAAEAVSVGVLSDGDMMLMYGSTIFIIQVQNQKTTDPRLWYAPWLYPGQHASMAGLATSGTITHWFRDQFARDLDVESAFENLAKEAAQSPKGANGLLVLPYFSGERTPIHDPHAKGVIFGLDLTHNRGDIYRAFLEGIALGTAHVLETYEEVGQSPKRIVAVGGGTKNNIWLQGTSDCCNRQQEIRRISSGASYGNTFLAAQALDWVQPSDINLWNPTEQQIDPETDAILYASRFKLFKQLYQSTRDIAHTLK